MGSREGMFPVNFVDVKSPLPGLPTNIVTALYSFKAETSDDLSLEVRSRHEDNCFSMTTIFLIMFRSIIFCND